MLELGLEPALERREQDRQRKGPGQSGQKRQDKQLAEIDGASRCSQQHKHLHMTARAPVIVGCFHCWQEFGRIHASVLVSALSGFVISGISPPSFSQRSMARRLSMSAALINRVGGTIKSKIAASIFRALIVGYSGFIPQPSGVLRSVPIRLGANPAHHFPQPRRGFGS